MVLYCVMSLICFAVFCTGLSCAHQDHLWDWTLLYTLSYTDASIITFREMERKGTNRHTDRQTNIADTRLNGPKGPIQ